MNLRHTHRFLRAEFDWLAQDRDGVLGFFSTAGAGPIPEALESDGAALALEDILALPKRGEAVRVGGEGNVNEWIEIAERGIFAFDWSRETRRYELIAQPTSPMRAEELKDERLCHLASLAEWPRSIE